MLVGSQLSICRVFVYDDEGDESFYIFSHFDNFLHTPSDDEVKAKIYLVNSSALGV
jgi:hypothetical protein